MKLELNCFILANALPKLYTISRSENLFRRSEALSQSPLSLWRRVWTDFFSILPCRKYSSWFNLPKTAILKGWTGNDERTISFQVSPVDEVIIKPRLSFYDLCTLTYQFVTTRTHTHTHTPGHNPQAFEFFFIFSCQIPLPRVRNAVQMPHTRAIFFTV